MTRPSPATPGETHNDLTAVAPTEKKNRSGGRLWLFVCTCGNTITSHISLVRCGKKRHCGCKNKPRKNPDWERGRQMRHEGKTYKQIAAVLGISGSYASNKL
jgi:hypothetical protein